MELSIASRPVANDMYQIRRNTPVDAYRRKAPTPSTVERTIDDRSNLVPWQQKVPGPVNPPDRTVGPIRQRYTPVQQQQPYKSRVGQQVQQQFFALETPKYFQNNVSAAPVAVVKASHNIPPKQQQATYPTPPVYR